MTKNLGTTWLTRSPGGTGSIIDLQVDPRNSDIVYALYNSDQVWVTTTAGLSWTNISGTGSGKLPTLNSVGAPVYGWALQLDPRTGFLYVGTDQGVYVSTNGGTSWQQFGIGLANVQVRTMVLNQTENTLTIGTYGRGTYQAWLDTSQPDGGGFSALPGSNASWTGPVQLAGATTVGATSIYDALQTGFPTAPPANDQYDAQSIDNGYATGSLNILGTISDQIPGADWTITKIGLGNVIFSGSNTFGGTAIIQEGALVVHNPQALGQTGVADVQQITLVDPTPGTTTYYLGFGGVPVQRNPVQRDAGVRHDAGDRRLHAGADAAGHAQQQWPGRHGDRHLRPDRHGVHGHLRRRHDRVCPAGDDRDGHEHAPAPPASTSPAACRSSR